MNFIELTESIEYINSDDPRLNGRLGIKEFYFETTADWNSYSDIYTVMGMVGGSRDDGKVIYFGKLHREDGPAITRNNGNKDWYLHGKRHRTDGPAVVHDKGKFKEWWLHGKRHRIDGPALINIKHGIIEYWVRGRQMTKEEYEKHFEIKSDK